MLNNKVYYLTCVKHYNTLSNLCYTIKYFVHPLLHNKVLFEPVLYNKVLFEPVLYNKVLFETVLYNKVFFEPVLYLVKHLSISLMRFELDKTASIPRYRQEAELIFGVRAVFCSAS